MHCCLSYSVVGPTNHSTHLSVLPRGVVVRQEAATQDAEPKAPTCVVRPGTCFVLVSLNLSFRPARPTMLSVMPFTATRTIDKTPAAAQGPWLERSRTTMVHEFVAIAGNVLPPCQTLQEVTMGIVTRVSQSPVMVSCNQLLQAGSLAGAADEGSLEELLSCRTMLRILTETQLDKLLERLGPLAARCTDVLFGLLNLLHLALEGATCIWNRSWTCEICDLEIVEGYAGGTGVFFLGFG